VQIFLLASMSLLGPVPAGCADCLFSVKLLQRVELIINITNVIGLLLGPPVQKLNAVMELKLVGPRHFSNAVQHNMSLCSQREYSLTLQS